jgi:hypothetical protein
LFCCGSSLEAQRAGTRAAANKYKTKQAAHFQPRDVRRLMRGGGWKGGGGWAPLASVKHALFPHEIDDDGDNDDGGGGGDDGDDGDDDGEDDYDDDGSTVN